MALPPNSSSLTGGRASVLPLSSQADRVRFEPWPCDRVVQIVHVWFHPVQRRVVDHMRRILEPPMFVLFLLFIYLYLVAVLAYLPREFMVLRLKQVEGAVVVLLGTLLATSRPALKLFLVEHLSETNQIRIKYRFC